MENYNVQDQVDFSRGTFPEQEKEVSLQDYVRILYRGRWIILISFIVVIVNSTNKCNSGTIWKSGQAAVSFGLFFPQKERCTNGFIQTAYPGTKIRNLFVD